jgi:hypothetical protein
MKKLLVRLYGIISFVLAIPFMAFALCVWSIIVVWNCLTTEMTIQEHVCDDGGLIDILKDGYSVMFKAIIKGEL